MTPAQRHLLSGMLCCATLPSFGQLILNGTTSPSTLVQDVLLGTGVVANNITFNGQPGNLLNAQIGSFNGSNCNIGMAAGVILATGNINAALGPNNSGSFSLGGGNLNAGDADLLAVSQASNPNINDINDAAVLEFDFIPQGDSLRFDFVFASEEYLEFVNSVNDVFGFFISGPGINGPYGNNAINIALIPGTNQPVTIDDVNSTVNSAFYVINGDGFTAPFNSNTHFVQYDGFTVPMTARAQVQCGQPYHIKIAVGDASDAVWDSAVFLQAGSFTSNAVQLTQQVETGGQDSTLYEGCGQSMIVLSRPGDVSGTASVELVTQGQATEGVDYNALPDIFTFQPGEDSLFITINAIDDNQAEGTELVELLAVTAGNCGTDSTILHLYISDAPQIDLVMSGNATLPCNDSVFVSGTATGGFGALQLDWNTGIADGTAGAWVMPAQTTAYTLTVTDDCGVHMEQGSVTVTVPQPAPLVLQALPDTVVYCPESAVGLHSIVQGGTAPYAYSWTDGLGTAPSATVAPPITHAWTLTVHDHCGLVISDEVTVHVQYDTVQVEVSPDTVVCYRDTARLRAYPSFGTGSYELVWNDGATGAMHDVVPASSGYCTITVSDACGISDSASIHVGLNVPIADMDIEAGDFMVGLPIQFLDRSTGAAVWSWEFDYNGETSEMQDPTMVYPEPGIYTIILTIADSLGCVDSTFQVIIIDPEAHFYLPTAFTPNGDGINEDFGPVGMGVLDFAMRIYDRWGELIFASDDTARRWDGTYDGAPAPEGMYVVWFRLRDALNDKREHYGTVLLSR